MKKNFKKELVKILKDKKNIQYKKRINKSKRYIHVKMIKTSQIIKYTI